LLIYLIEDDNLKSGKIIPFLRSIGEGAKIEHFRSYQSGLKGVEARLPDLLILDMTLPTFDMSGISRHGRPRSLGGYEIMRKMKRRGMFCPVFVISALETFGDGKTKISFDEIGQRCLDEFPMMFTGAAFFSLTSEKWKEPLRQAVVDATKHGKTE
jgi:CheY-like chemotaxis protein